ncbi:hypothetical protein ABZ746_20240 [Streptomyces sp. NPDC020096]
MTGRQEHPPLAGSLEPTQAGVRAVAPRAVGLRPESPEAIAAVLDQARTPRGLPPVEK